MILEKDVQAKLKTKINFFVCLSTNLNKKLKKKTVTRAHSNTVIATSLRFKEVHIYTAKPCGAERLIIKTVKGANQSVARLTQHKETVGILYIYSIYDYYMNSTSMQSE